MLRAQVHGSIDEIIVVADASQPPSGEVRRSKVSVEFRLREEHVDALIADLQKAKREIAKRNKRLGYPLKKK